MDADRKQRAVGDPEAAWVNDGGSSRRNADRALVLGTIDDDHDYYGGGYEVGDSESFDINGGHSQKLEICEREAS